MGWHGGGKGAERVGQGKGPSFEEFLKKTLSEWNGYGKGAGKGKGGGKAGGTSTLSSTANDMNGQGKGGAKLSGHGHTRRPEWECEFCTTTNFLDRVTCRFCKCPRQRTSKKGGIKGGSGGEQQRASRWERGTQQPNPPPDTKEGAAAAPAKTDAAPAPAGRVKVEPAASAAEGGPDRAALTAAAMLLKQAGLMTEKQLAKIPGFEPKKVQPKLAPIGNRLDRAREVVKRLEARLEFCHTACNAATVELIATGERLEKAKVAAEELEAEVAMTAAATPAPARSANALRKQLLQVRKVVTSNEDPLDALRTIQLLLARYEAAEASGDDSSDSDGPAHDGSAGMSDLDGDLSEVSTSWLVRDGKGRMRPQPEDESGAVRERERDRSPRLRPRRRLRGTATPR